MGHRTTPVYAIVYAIPPRFPVLQADFGLLIEVNLGTEVDSIEGGTWGSHDGISTCIWDALPVSIRSFLFVGRVWHCVLGRRGATATLLASAF